MNQYYYYTIKEILSEEMILGQLMEECAELAQVAHKIIRILQGVNLPHGNRVYADDLNEELADVLACVSMLDFVNWDLVERIKKEKIARWASRLQEEVKRRDNNGENR